MFCILTDTISKGTCSTRELSAFTLLLIGLIRSLVICVIIMVYKCDTCHYYGLHVWHMHSNMQHQQLFTLFTASCRLAMAGRCFTVWLALRGSSSGVSRVLAAGSGQELPTCLSVLKMSFKNPSTCLQRKLSSSTHTYIHKEVKNVCRYLRWMKVFKHVNTYALPVYFYHKACRACVPFNTANTYVQSQLNIYNQLCS